MASLPKDEKKYSAYLQQRKMISMRAINIMGGMEKINRILAEKGLRLEKSALGTRKNPYFLIKRGKRTQISRLPCGIPKKEKISCGHFKSCYLAWKCPAAHKHIKLFDVPDEELGRTINCGGKVIW